ncbi:MAG: outer membrane lipoprotein carrier protein LolA [Lentisphaerae bacterium]|nr:outer membrane lipoprotein carrier protein LolA [Lentisphaerota bacterium]
MRFRKLTVVFCGFLLVSVVVAGADSAEDPLINTHPDLKNIDTLQAEFTQTKQIALLNHRVVITGELCLEKNDGRMAWHVASPIRYSCVITKQSLTQWDIDSDQQVTLSVDRYTWLKVLSQNLKDWFSGNFQNMSSGFTAEIGDRREMLMTPRPDNRIAEFIKSIKFYFADDGSSVSQVIFTEINGDTTDITFNNIKINQPIPPEKWNVKPN